MSPLIVLALIAAVILMPRVPAAVRPLLVVAAVLALVISGSAAWIVHPLAGITLYLFAANVVFTSPKRRNPLQVLGVSAFIVVLALLGASWIVHPAAGITLALLASAVFGKWRREVPSIIFAAGFLTLMYTLGAVWVFHPMAGVMLAWFAVAAFSGELFGKGRSQPGKAGTRTAPALPAEGAEPFGVPGRWDRETEYVPAERQARRKRNGQRTARGSGGAAVQTSPEPRPEPQYPVELNRLLAENVTRLPAEAAVRLRQLIERLQEVKRTVDSHGDADPQSRMLVEQIAEDYAPGAVQAYLRLPPSTANVTPIHGERTGKDLLVEQLDMLIEAATRLLRDATVASAQDILIHQRFLKEKFRKKSDFEL